MMYIKNRKVVEIRGAVPYQFFELLFECMYEEGSWLSPSNEVMRPKLVIREVLKCETYAVLEPLKIRMITKGPAKEYALVKFFQKAMWKHLQNFEQFRLTGEVLNGSHIYDLISRTRTFERVNGAIPNEFSLFVSGDYAAATDNIDAGLSQILLEELVEKVIIDYFSKIDVDVNQDWVEEQKKVFSEYHYFDEEDNFVTVPGWEFVKLPRPAKAPKRGTSEYEHTYISELEDIIKKVLAPHEVRYPDGDVIMQSNGQLMGSPLSFPILCGINFIAYWRSLEEYFGGKVMMKEIPCLVNGDDILFMSNEAHYDLWKEEIEKVGFKLSIGKNYIHKNLLTVNSKLFEFSHGIVKEIPYFNVGLLTGQSKVVQLDRKEDPVRRLSDNYRIVMEGAMNPLRAHYRFLHYNKNSLPKTLENWFVPAELGGLGFPVYDDVKHTVRVTEFQKCLATKCIRDRESKIGYVTKGKTTHTRDCYLQKVILPVYGPYAEHLIREPDLTINIINSDFCLDTKLVFKSSKNSEVSCHRPYGGSMLDRCFTYGRSTGSQVKSTESILEEICEEENTDMGAVV
jgi:hypothetical protein